MSPHARDHVRTKNEEVGAGLEVPPELPRPLRVGQEVTARHPGTRQLHDGVVLTAKGGRYRCVCRQRGVMCVWGWCGDDHKKGVLQALLCVWSVCVTRGGGDSRQVGKNKATLVQADSDTCSDLQLKLFTKPATVPSATCTADP